MWTSRPTDTVVESNTVGDLRMWLYRGPPPATHDTAQAPTTFTQRPDATPQAAPSCLRTTKGAHGAPVARSPFGMRGWPPSPRPWRPQHVPTATALQVVANRGAGAA